jgi:hypothetical protein
MIEKIKLLLQRLKRELQPDTELLVVMVPTQPYFDRNFSNEHNFLTLHSSNLEKEVFLKH